MKPKKNASVSFLNSIRPECRVNNFQYSKDSQRTTKNWKSGGQSTTTNVSPAHAILMFAENLSISATDILDMVLSKDVYQKAIKNYRTTN